VHVNAVSLAHGKAKAMFEARLLRAEPLLQWVDFGSPCHISGCAGVLVLDLVLVFPKREDSRFMQVEMMWGAPQRYAS
jgi:hypothetical protein